MIVGRNFYNNSLQVTLRRGVALSESHVRTIRHVNISGLYIDDEQTRDIIIKPLLEEDLKLNFAHEVQNVFSSVQSMVEPETGMIEDMIHSVIAQISGRTNQLVSMFDLKAFDDYIFQHSIDVCILAVVAGQALQLSPHLLNNLAVSAVYHDIGKMHIDQQVVNKRGPLTDEEYAIMQKHPAMSVEFVKKIGVTRDDILQGIAQHHERMDGTGYPDAVAGEKIGLFGRIIALSDVFDAITSKRTYKEAALPSEAVEQVLTGAGGPFDRALAELFVNNISVYPVGLTVRLSNGMTGVVAENHAGFAMRPRIKVFSGEAGSPPFLIDLKNDFSARNISIVETLD